MHGEAAFFLSGWALFRVARKRRAANVAQPNDDRSPLAIGMSWATTIMALSAQMAVPPLLGYWVDQRLGTRLVFLFLGLALGVTLSTLGLIRIAKQQAGPGDGHQDGG